MPQFDSIPAMISECFDRDISRERNWYQRYKQTHEKIIADPTSDNALELLWYVRDNAVSSLMQGNTSKEEFERAKPRLRLLTKKLIESPSSETYEAAIQEMRDLKSEGTLRQFYGALLNRAFAAIVPDKVTSSVKEPAFNLAANFINGHFNLGLNLNGNWYENNFALKNALREKVPDEFDDFKINIAVWNVFELLEEENKIDDSLIESEIDQQKVKPLSLTVEQYKEVLKADGVVNKNSRKLLSAMGNSSASKITASQLAKDLGLAHVGPVNARIGQLSKRIANYFGIDKQDIKNRFTGWWQLIADGEHLPDGFIWRLKDNLKTALAELGIIDDINMQGIKEKSQDYSAQTALNQIFYGPPGTGKTYRTIEAAVRAAEPSFTFTSREDLKAKYDELVTLKRIQFVTFHQSYGYEEFVEGLRAVTEDGQVCYEVQAGIFKRICTSASKNIVKSQRSAYEGFETCWDAFLEEFDDEHGIKVSTKKAWFRVTEVTENTIHFEKANGTSKHSLAIKTLKAIFNGSKVVKGGLNVYYQPLVEHLKSYANRNSGPIEPPKNFVLIIDEINRGNISKIFGELITLIEDSKRSFNGGTESIEVTLPYSEASLSVPANLYLIGTMNTADRSLAMMDTALRRRFDFVEMMPNYSLLSGQVVKGIQLDALLHKMNARIEVLYDREHTLGHAFFVPVVKAIQKGDEANAFNSLKLVFLNKIIPLLEEYFFDDWNKIRLVLGDNQKPVELQFVKILSTNFDELFGSNHELDSFVNQNETFDLALPSADVWGNPLAYQNIYNPKAE